MLEVYCGDGKGKTTAAAGLAMRMAGRGRQVLFIQFLKDGTSAEVQLLKVFEEIEVRIPAHFYGFTSSLSEGQKEKLRSAYGDVLQYAKERAREMAFSELYSFSTEETEPVRGLIVLDEVLHAVNAGLIAEEDLMELAECCPPDVELVLTGRNPGERLLEIADYISEIQKVRHPYDCGTAAREGIEY